MLFGKSCGLNDKGSVVKATIKSVEPKAAIVELAEDVEAVLKASEISVDKVEDARNSLKDGDEIEVKIVNVDRKNRSINVSIKAVAIADEKEAIKQHKEKEAESANPTTICDLIKAQMDK